MADKKREGTRGEGDYEGTRDYDEHATEFARSGKAKAAAEQARRDVEEHGRELAEAERKGKERAAEEDPELYEKGVPGEDD